MLDSLNLNSPVAQRALEESRQNIARHQREMQAQKELKEANDRRAAEERKKTLEMKNRLAEENAKHRENVREQRRKAAEVAMDKLVMNRKRRRDE